MNVVLTGLGGFYKEVLGRLGIPPDLKDDVNARRDTNDPRDHLNCCGEVHADVLSRSIWPTAHLIIRQCPVTPAASPASRRLPSNIWRQPVGRSATCACAD